MTHSSYCSGPKSARLGEYLYELANEYKLSIRITNRDRRWFTETIYFDLTGDHKSIVAAEQRVSQDFNRVNGGKEA